MRNFTKNKNGTSILEVIIALGLFSTIITIALLTFGGVMKGQRSTLNAQNVQESLRFAFEIISKEIRFAKKRDTGVCTLAGAGGNKKVYDVNAAGDVLRFINSSGLCTTYDSALNRFRIRRGAQQFPFTPDEITVSNLRFDVIDEAVNTSPQTVQPMVTITVNGSMGTATSTKEEFQVQTTISSRNYQ